MRHRSAELCREQTDCPAPVDLHFLNINNAMFALDDVIYTLRRR